MLPRPGIGDQGVRWYKWSPGVVSPSRTETTEEGTTEQILELWRDTAIAECPLKLRGNGGEDTSMVSFHTLQIPTSAFHLPNLTRSQLEREPGKFILQDPPPYYTEQNWERVGNKFESKWANNFHVADSCSSFRLLLTDLHRVPSFEIVGESPLSSTRPAWSFSAQHVTVMNLFAETTVE